MKIERKDGASERAILIGMIVSKDVLARIAARWNRNLFASKWSNLVASWCVDYYMRHSEAPGKNIVGLFRNWSEKSKDADSSDLVDKFLASLSGDYEEQSKEINAGYLSDEATKYFTRVRLSRLKDSIEGDLDSGDIEGACNRITKFQKIEVGTGEGVDLFLDKEAVFAASGDSRKDELISLKGGLNTFFQGALERDGFVGILAPNKTGKSFWLQELAFRAMRQRRKVAYFVVGDMSAKQVKRRLLTRLVHRPYRAFPKADGWPYTVKWPTKLIPPEGPVGQVSVECDEIVFDKAPIPADVWTACERLMEKRIKSKESYFRMSIHPSASISILGIKSILDTWALNGFVADVVAIDYADTLAPIGGSKEKRDQINDTWMRMRAISQELHCLVLTATQADARSFDRSTLDRSNFSEDRRKLDHVTGMVGINVTSAERKDGLCRLNWLALREGNWNPVQCCYVAGCLALANPAVLSEFGRP